MQVVFWVSLMLLIYTVALYPLLLTLMGLILEGKGIIRDDSVRKVALVVPVHNGEDEIESKIRNCLELEYPADMMEIYVVSDASTDGTVEIIKRYSEQGVHCLAFHERRGKVAAQNKALPFIKDAEILIFTDVAIQVSPSALKFIVSNFADPTVGAVSCRDEIVTQEKGQGDALYIRYDMLIRSLTMKVGSLIGVTGGFYAVRREIANEGWEPAFPPDFYVALKAIAMEFRVIEDSRVMARYLTPQSDNFELARKVRSITRGMWALFFNITLMNPLKHPMVSLQLISHKLLRWLAPLFFLICFIISGSLTLENIQPYPFLFYIQLIICMMGATALIADRLGFGTLRFLQLPKLFLLFNWAILVSWKNYLTGKKIVQWEPTVRSSGAG